MSVPFGSHPMHVTCPVCKASVVTDVEYAITAVTHCFAIILCIFGFFLCAPCVYCSKCSRDVDHYCPNCHAYLGTYNRFSMSLPVVGPESNQLLCPQCQQSIATTIVYKPSNRTHLLALLLCGIGCCPCAGALYCTQCARDVEHYCPACNSYLGVYKR